MHGRAHGVTCKAADPIPTFAMGMGNKWGTALLCATARGRVLGRRAVVARGWVSVAGVDVHVARGRVSVARGWVPDARGWDSVAGVGLYVVIWRVSTVVGGRVYLGDIGREGLQHPVHWHMFIPADTSAVRVVCAHTHTHAHFFMNSIFATNSTGRLQKIKESQC